VPSIRSTHVEVYLFRRRAGRVEFLALRRAPGMALPGVWQPVTGRITRGETAFAAARREVREETGLSPGQWWCLETMTTFFDPATDSVRLLPLFAAELRASDRVRLSPEHDAARFAGARTAARLYLWETQRRALEAVRREALGRSSAGRALAAPRSGNAARMRPRRKTPR
jgi:dATP pyrophosphohydrolase